MHVCIRALYEDVDTILSVSVPTDIQKQRHPDSREGHHAGRGETVECYRKSARLNKIAIQGRGPDGKWTWKPLAYRESNNV